MVNKCAQFVIKKLDRKQNLERFRRKAGYTLCSAPPIGVVGSSSHGNGCRGDGGVQPISARGRMLPESGCSSGAAFGQRFPGNRRTDVVVTARCYATVLGPLNGDNCVTWTSYEQSFVVAFVVLERKQCRCQQTCKRKKHSTTLNIEHRRENTSCKPMRPRHEYCSYSVRRKIDKFVT